MVQLLFSNSVSHYFSIPFIHHPWLPAYCRYRGILKPTIPRPVVPPYPSIPPVYCCFGVLSSAVPLLLLESQPFTLLYYPSTSLLSFSLSIFHVFTTKHTCFGVSYRCTCRKHLHHHNTQHTSPPLTSSTSDPYNNNFF